MMHPAEGLFSGDFLGHAAPTDLREPVSEYNVSIVSHPSAR